MRNNGGVRRRKVTTTVAGTWPLTRVRCGQRRSGDPPHRRRNRLVRRSSIALELARSGLRVVVVDKFGGAGNGSTSTSSAVARFTYPTIAGVNAAWESLHCWEAWRDHLQAPAGEPLAAFNRCGVTMLDVDFAPCSLFTRHFDKVGVPYEEWDAQELSEQLPAVDTGRYFPPRPVDDDEFFADASARLGALHTPDGGFVDDPQLAARNLAAAAQRHRATFRALTHTCEHTGQTIDLGAFSRRRRPAASTGTVLG